MVAGDAADADAGDDVHRDADNYGTRRGPRSKRPPWRHSWRDADVTDAGQLSAEESPGSDSWLSRKRGSPDAENECCMWRHTHCCLGAIVASDVGGILGENGADEDADGDSAPLHTDTGMATSSGVRSS